MEGRFHAVNSLMANIRKDKRVTIYKELSKRLSVLNHRWHVAMCYTFQKNPEQFWLKEDEARTLTEMFDSLKNTFDIRLEGCKINDFYKNAVDALLLKYISMAG